MSTRRPNLDELIPVTERIRWMQICRVLMLLALPVLAVSTGAAPAVTRQLGVAGLGWLAFGAVTWIVARAGRWLAVTSLNLTLLGDGLVLAWAWYRLGDLAGPVGALIMLHTLAVTLAVSFRTGAKIALWHSLLAILVLDARAVGLLGTAMPFPTRQAVTYFIGLWAAALATAALAAVNERELRRRRHDERALLALALQLGEDADPASVAARLADFGVGEAAARRAAVVVTLFGAQPGDRQAVICAVSGPGGTSQVHELGAETQPPTLTPDEVVLVHRPGRGSHSWLTAVLPGAENIVLIPFGIGPIRGALILELRRRRSARLSRRVDRAMIATARQAAAQSASALGRAVVTATLTATANTDGLTGLANRARFDKRLAVRAAGGTPFGLIMVDLDHFKQVNDSYGHTTGDAVLVGVAGALRAACRSGDDVARYGGEEFVVLIDGGALEVEETAERLRLAVSLALTPVAVTASLGGACFPAEAAGTAALTELADQRLYLAKGNGRNQAVTGFAGLVSQTAMLDDAAPAGGSRDGGAEVHQIHAEEADRAPGLAGPSGSFHPS